MESVIAEHQLPEETPILYLDATSAFESLTDKERLYTHYLSLASWAGKRIELRQCSFESETIYDLIISLFSGTSVDTLAAKAQAAGVSELAWKRFLQYVAVFLGMLLMIL